MLRGLLLVVTVGLFAVGAYYGLRESGEPGASPDPTSAWERVEASETESSYAAVQAYRFNALELRVPAESKVALDQAWPAVLEGSVELAAQEEFRYERGLAAEGTLALSPGARLRVTSHGFSIIGGLISWRGNPLAIGSTWSWSDLDSYPPSIVSDATDPTDGSTDRESGTDRPASSSPTSVTGQVVDARTGRGIPGVAVQITYSHERDGYPLAPLADPRSVVVTAVEGRFVVPNPSPEDPRLLAHLQVVDPGYAPTVEVIGPAVASGEWPTTRIELRPTRTVEHQFFDRAQRPLAHHPVELLEYRDPYLASDDPAIQGAAPTNVFGLARAEPRRFVVYTDSNGALSLTRAWHQAELLTPEFTALDRDDPTPSWLSRLRLDLQSIDPVDRPVLHVLEPTVVHDRYFLTDRNGTPLDRVLVEVEIPEEGRRFRQYTDDLGAIVVGVDERARNLPPVRQQPISFSITVRSPRLQGHRFDLLIPSVDERFAADAREAALLSFRTLNPNADGEFEPWVPDGLKVDFDLTPVHRGADGFMQFRGPLPTRASAVWVRARGRIPVEVPIPTLLQGKPAVDLGDVALEPGRSLVVRVEGLLPQSAGRAVLAVRRPTDRDVSLRGAPVPEDWYRYPVGVDGTVRIGGLEDGLRYSLRLEGPGIPRVDDELWAHRETYEKGHTLRLRDEFTPDRPLIVSGQLSTVDLTDTSDYRVIERFYYGTGRDPVIFRSYVLGSSGEFGSRRVVPRPKAVEVLVLGRGLGFARFGPRPLTDGNGLFNTRTLTVDPTRYGLFAFVAEGVGLTLPPQNLRLIADTDRNHEIAQWERPEDDIRLRVRHLLPGRYRLLWNEPDGPAGGHRFVVDAGSVGFEEVVLRPPALEERVLIRLVDSNGDPVDELRSIWSDVVDTSEEWTRVDGVGQSAERIAPGLFAVLIRTTASNRIVIEPANGLLPLTVLVPKGQMVPAELTLGRPTRAIARVLDANGQLASGPLRWSWTPSPLNLDAASEPAEPDDPGPVLVQHGRPVIADARQGRVEVELLPLGTTRLEVRQLRSEAADVREVTFVDGMNDLGLIELGERRKLVGHVWLPRGAAAEGARVRLIPRSLAYRYPLVPATPDATAFEAIVGVDGRFEIEGLPATLDRELALVAQLDGFTSAVEYPVDLELRERALVLEAGTELVVRTQYTEGAAPTGYRFELDYLPFDPTFPVIPLGVLEGDARLESFDVRPGIYRLTWTHERPLPTFQPQSIELELYPGNRRELSLVIPVGAFEGTATFNGKPLERGWVAFTDDPSDPTRWTLASVESGRFSGAIPVGGRRLFATVIPDTDPPPRLDLSTGEGLPIEVAARDVERGSASLHYEAYTVTVRIPSAAEREITIETDAHVWRGNRWDRVDGEPWVVEGDRAIFTLVRPGPFRFKVSASGGSGWTASREVLVEEDVEVWIRR
ncbi:MAG: hypothetical protein AAF488_08660 [Planctomycetota bacterium]